MSWLKENKSSGYLSSILQVKADQKVTVRLLDEVSPVVVWRHSCRDVAGTFVKALCIGNRSGCGLCKINASEKYAGLKNADKPYPIGSEYVKPVYVYEEKRPMLVVGNTIWKQLGVMADGGVSLVDKDFSIVRQDNKKQVTYTVVPLNSGPFTVAIDDKDIPKVETYVEWLNKNIEKVILLTPVTNQSRSDEEAKEDPQPAFLKRPAEAPPQQPVVATEEVSAARKLLMERVGLAITKPFNSPAIAACLQKINAARKMKDLNAPVAGDITKMSDEELASFIDMYQTEVKAK